MNPWTWREDRLNDDDDERRLNYLDENSPR